MKKLITLLCCLIVIGTVQAQSVKFTPEKPEAGKPLVFEYDPAGGKLDKLADVKCNAYTFINKKQKVVPVPLVRKGAVYQGSFTPADSTSIAVLAFNAGATRDEHPDGYYTLFYKDGKPTAMSYYWEAQYYNGMGAAFVGAKLDKQKSIKAFENAFDADPSIKNIYLPAYLSLQYSVDKVNGEKLISRQVALLNNIQPVTEENLLKIGNYYATIKRKPSADSVYQIVMKRFPKGNYAFNTRSAAVYAEKDAAKKEMQVNQIIKEFDLKESDPAGATRLSNFYGTLAGAYGLAKNNEKFSYYADKIKDKSTLASLYNTYAWAGAEQKENLEFAAKISKKSLELLEAAKSEAVPEYYPSRDAYLKDIESNYASYADTYALLEDHLGNHAEALKYQEIAVKMNGFTKPEMNERYITFLRKNKETQKAVEHAEKFIREGLGTDVMIGELKSMYKGTGSFDVYLADLQKEAMEKERAKFISEMINMPAPVFALYNLEGKKVELANLKGKVVIIDYWATWCGPCIASFPGMQKAVDKYKSDPDVVFLFINTLQREEAREKVVKDFMAETKYTFNVLLDTKDKKEPEKFEVIEQYKVEGIPTKFIVDRNGNIRFKKVGFGGTAEGTVKELDMMISLAKGAK